MLDEKAVEDLKAKHGSAIRIYIPETKFDEEIEIFVKKPSRAEYKRFRAMLVNVEEKADALETLALACVIHPEPADFKKMLNDRPALADKVGGQLSDFCGGGGEAEAKKM